MLLVLLQIDFVTCLDTLQVSKIIGLTPTIWVGVTIDIKYNVAELEVEKILPVLLYAVLDVKIMSNKMVVVVAL